MKAVCAIIFPSILLHGSLLGDRIDSYDNVFRFNHHVHSHQSPHSADVGVKTTHVVANAFELNDKTIYPCAQADIECLIAFSRTGLDKVWKNRNLDIYHRDMMYVKNNTVSLFPDALYEEALDTFSRCVLQTSNAHISSRTLVPSTGYKAVYYALHVCKSIDIYGFSMSIDHDKYLEYDTLSKECECHDFFKEHRCLVDLTDDARVDSRQGVLHLDLEGSII